MIGAIGLALIMGWLAHQADGRYVQKEYYKVDQDRIGKQLDDIQSDIKTLLRRP